jgi:hypothetical protein
MTVIKAAGVFMKILQPGMVALITNHKYIDNIGHRVRLIRFVNNKETIDIPSVGEIRNMTGHSGWLVAGDISTRTFDPDTNEFNVQEGFSICEPGQLIILDDNNGLTLGIEIHRLEYAQVNS